MKQFFILTLLMLVINAAVAQSDSQTNYPKPDHIIAYELYQQGLITHRYAPFTGLGAVTALSSSIVTGSGQMINGQVGKGALFLITGMTGYMIAANAESVSSAKKGILIWLGAGIVSMIDAAVVSTKNNQTFKNAQYQEYKKVAVEPYIGLLQIPVEPNKAIPQIGLCLVF